MWLQFFYQKSVWLVISTFFILVRICCIDKTLTSPLVFPETECLLWDFWESAANLLIFHTLPSLQTLVLSHFMFRISRYGAFRLLRGQYQGSILSLCVIVVLSYYFISAIWSIYIYKYVKQTIWIRLYICFYLILLTPSWRIAWKCL